MDSGVSVLCSRLRELSCAGAVPMAGLCCGVGGRKQGWDSAVPQPFLLCRHFLGEWDNPSLPGHCRGSQGWPPRTGSTHTEGPWRGQTWPSGTMSTPGASPSLLVEFQAPEARWAEAAHSHECFCRGIPCRIGLLWNLTLLSQSSAQPWGCSEPGGGREGVAVTPAGTQQGHGDQQEVTHRQVTGQM